MPRSEVTVALLRRRIGEQVRYMGLGIRLGQFAADRRSRATFALLGTIVLVKQRTRWAMRPLGLTIRLKERDFPIFVTDRIDLEVLKEIALNDEYGPSDAFDAKVIVDLGAHVGYATLRLLAGRPEARVIAVEADPMLLPRLRANVAGLPVTVVHAAIGGESGQRTFYRSENFSWGNSVSRSQPTQEAYDVPARTFGELMAEHGLGAADLVKIDIEGAEWEVLESGVPPCVQALIGELHASAGRSPEELVEAIAASMTLTATRADAERVVFSARREAPAVPGIAVES